MNVSKVPDNLKQKEKDRVISALNSLKQEELDRLRLKIRRKFSWLKGSYEPDDFLFEAIEELINGKRKWPQGMNLQWCLFKITGWKISEYVSNGRTEIVTLTGMEDYISDENDSKEDSIPDEDAAVDTILKLIKGDEFLEKMVRFILKTGIIKSGEIAEKLDVDINEIYNATKRLKNRLKNVDWNSLGEGDN